MAKRKKRSRFGANVARNVARQKSNAKGFGYLDLPKDIKMFKEKEGRNKLDIIPYMVTDKKHPDGNLDDEAAANVGNPWYRRPIFVHRSIGADNESIICPKSIGKKCPICELREQQFKEGMDKDDVVKKPGARNLYVVIPINNKEFEEEMHIWDIAQGNFQERLNMEIDDDITNGNFPDPEDGSTLNIRFSEESFSGNKYFEASMINFLERDGYEESIMDEAPNLDEIIKVLSYKEIEAKFLDVEEEEDEEEEEDDAPAKKSYRKKKVVKDEEDEEEEYDEDEEEDAGYDSDDEEEEEEYDDDEEEEAPAPKRKSRSAVKKKPERVARGSKRNPKTKKCPSGHKFAEDWDAVDDCDDCKLFDACGDANEEL